jgi:hypothetical protein
MTAYSFAGRISPCALFATMLTIVAATTSAQASVEISANATRNMNCADGVCSPTAKKAVLNVHDLTSMLASGDVTIVSGGVAKDITVKAKLSWVSASRLTLDSYHAIMFDKPVVVAGSGAVTITTNDGGSGGDFGFNGKGHIEFWDLSSEPIVNGQRYALVGNMAQLTRLARRSQFIAMAKTINASKQSYTTPPIGSVQGTLEGFGNTISNFTIVDATPSDVCVGLIGCVDQPGVPTLRDIRMKTVNVTGTQTSQQVGALAGVNPGSIIGCSVSGQVSATGQHAHAGGLAGGTLAVSAISRSSSTASVSATGSNSAAGGLVGQATGPLDESFATGTVAVGDSSTSGGLIGIQAQGTVSDSYATGAVSGGSNSVVGGFIGSNTSGLHIATSYSLGSVSGDTGSTVGGFIGEDFTSSGLSNTYWNLDTSGMSDPSKGAGNIANDPGITGLTSSALQSGLPSGFDANVWAQSPTINGGLPYLASNPPQ